MDARLAEALSIAVILPCYNEETTIAKVVTDFRRHLPTANVYVYNNMSTDRTGELARDAGAIVHDEPTRGKGNVVRRMFADIEADVYVMADGDHTYDASSAPAMVEKLVRENLDMVVGTRLDSLGAGLFPAGHRLGNAVFTTFVGLLFGQGFRDILSGYRVFSRRFVKSFPALSAGFEIETRYFARPEGSTSKLSTFRDGLKILRSIVFLTKELRPLSFFGFIALILAAASIILAYPLLSTFIETGLVPRFPTAVLATGLMILASLSLTCGLVLGNVCTGRWEAKRMVYLSLPSVLQKIRGSAQASLSQSVR